MTLRRAYVDGPYGQLHLRIAGHGTPLILLHQSPLSGDQFSAVLPLLAEAGFCAVAMDTPGFGDSVRLQKRLAQSGNPIGWFLREVFDRYRDRPFWLSQQALRAAHAGAGQVDGKGPAAAVPCVMRQIGAAQDACGRGLFQRGGGDEAALPRHAVLWCQIEQPAKGPDRQPLGRALCPPCTPVD